MKKQIPVALAIICIILSLGTPLRAQENQLMSSPSGNILVHTSLNEFRAGTAIHFTAYLPPAANISSAETKPQLLIALFNKKGDELAGRRFEINGVSVSGNIDLPSELTEDNYILAAAISQPVITSTRDIMAIPVRINYFREAGLLTKINIPASEYKEGSKLVAGLEFKGKEAAPAAAAYTYKLLANDTELAEGKGKASKDGTGSLSLVLPAGSNSGQLKLIVTAEWKGYQRETGIVIPNDLSGKAMLTETSININGNSVPLNVKINTAKNIYSLNENIEGEIIVTDTDGKPANAILSVSCRNTGNPFPEKNIISVLPDVRDISEIQIYEPERAGKNIFSAALRQYFIKYLSDQYVGAGRQFHVSYRSNKKDDMDFIKAGKDEGYSPDRDIFSIIMQIKPYSLAGDKIIFTSSGISSLTNIDGALIVIDGINMGTDTKVLTTIPVADIAKVSVSTNSMDIQRYSGLNSVGLIEIFTKKWQDKKLAEKKAKLPAGDSLLWVTNLRTGPGGKTNFHFTGNTASEVSITVAATTLSGNRGVASHSLKVQ